VASEHTKQTHMSTPVSLVQQAVAGGATAGPPLSDETNEVLAKLQHLSGGGPSIGSDPPHQQQPTTHPQQAYVWHGISGLSHNQQQPSVSYHQPSLSYQQPTQMHQGGVAVAASSSYPYVAYQQQQPHHDSNNNTTATTLPAGATWARGLTIIGIIAALVAALPLRQFVDNYDALRNLPFVDSILRGLLVALGAFVFRSMIFED